MCGQKVIVSKSFTERGPGLALTKGSIIFAGLDPAAGAGLEREHLEKW